MKKYSKFVLLAALFVILGFAGVTVLAQSSSGTGSGGATSPMMVNIGPNGNVLMRGIVVGNPGTNSFVVKSWGGSWTVNTVTTTEMITLNRVIADLQDGDFVGVLGTVSSDGTFTVDARIVREWRGKLEVRDFDRDGLPDDQDFDDDNDGRPDSSDSRPNDHDNDGVNDDRDSDDDDDGIEDTRDSKLRDHDNDDSFDSRDRDDDNDNIDDFSDSKPFNRDNDGLNDKDDSDFFCGGKWRPAGDCNGPRGSYDNDSDDDDRVSDDNDSDDDSDNDSDEDDDNDSDDDEDDDSNTSSGSDD